MFDIHRMISAGEASWIFNGPVPGAHIFWESCGIGIDGADTGDTAALTGDAQAALDAAIQDGEKCAVVFNIHYSDDPLTFEFRVKEGDWFVADADGSSPIAASCLAGSGTGFEIRGTGLTGNIVRVTDIGLSF